MNIYRYFNSPDVAAHLRKIEHPFTAAEAAYVVNECLFATLEEKIAAWNEIIATYPDHSMAQRPHMDAVDSFHTFLKQYIAIQKKKLALFMEADNCLYDFSYDRTEPEQKRMESDQLFRSAEDCIAYCKEEFSEDADRHIRIRKRRITDSTKPCYRRSSLLLSSDFLPIDVEVDNLSDQESKINDAFDAMWFFFPVPFRRGDLVIDRATYGAAANPMVIGDFPIWYAADCIRNGMLLTSPDLAKKDARIGRYKKSGDNSDMTALCYYVSDDCNLWSDYIGNYLHFEYYDAPLQGRHQLLKPFGAFLAGTIGPELLCNSYCQIHKQIELETMETASKWYAKEALKNAGVLDDTAEY